MRPRRAASYHLAHLVPDQRCSPFLPPSIKPCFSLACRLASRGLCSWAVSKGRKAREDEIPNSTRPRASFSGLIDNMHACCTPHLCELFDPAVIHVRRHFTWGRFRDKDTVPFSCFFAILPLLPLRLVTFVHVPLADHWRSFVWEATGHGICASLIVRSPRYRSLTRAAHSLAPMVVGSLGIRCEAGNQFMRPFFFFWLRTSKHAKSKKESDPKVLGDPHALSTGRPRERRDM